MAIQCWHSRRQTRGPFITVLVATGLALSLVAQNPAWTSSISPSLLIQSPGSRGILGIRSTRGPLPKRLRNLRGLLKPRAQDAVSVQTGKQVAVIGGGLSGVMCAKRLSELGIDATVTIVEQAEVLGGRASTLKSSVGKTEVQFDHGAQYISPKGSSFQKIVEEWISAGLIRSWNARINIIDVTEVEDSELNDERLRYSTKMDTKSSTSPKWIGRDGLGSICKDILQKTNGINVLHSTRVTRAQRENSKWKLWAKNTVRSQDPSTDKVSVDEDTEEMLLGYYDAIVGTCRAIFDQSNSIFEGNFQENPVVSAPSENAPNPRNLTLSVCLAFDKPLPDLGFEAAIVNGARSLGWITHESSKISSKEMEERPDCWVLQSNEAVREFCNEPTQATLLKIENNDLRDYLIYALTERMIEDFLATAASLAGDKQIQDSDPTVIHTAEWYDGNPPSFKNSGMKERAYADRSIGMVACGDYLTGARIEDAVMSGIGAADEVAAILTEP